MKIFRLSAMLCLLLTASQPLHAIITFTQLTQDTFIVSHRVKFIGSRGQAMKLVYTKAASLCTAAGYAYMNVLGEDSQASQQYENANASLRVQFFMKDGEGRIDCSKNASDDYVEEATEKLAHQGYERPSAADSGPAASTPAMASDPGSSAGCNVDQIIAMAKSGLSAEQIKAACPVLACE